jgi:hypothetical protein
MCTHVDVTLDMLPFVCLPIAPLVAPYMLNDFLCLECNKNLEFTNEKDIMVYSHFGVLVFPHLEDVHMEFSYIDHAFAYPSLYLCCANGVVNKQGHVIDDVLRYHAHTYFAWSLLCEGTNGQPSTSTEHELTKRALESYLRKCIHEWFPPQTSTTHDLSMRAHRHLAKVTSFYMGNLAIIIELWLLFECRFVSLVQLIGFMRIEGAFESGQAIGKGVHLLPLHVDDVLSSRMTLFQEGGDDTARRTDAFLSYTSSTHQLGLLCCNKLEEQLLFPYVC